jgi:hypothetical protein
MTDLNALAPDNSPLYLLTACSVNDSGEIAGFGATSDGELHGFLATPCRENSGTCNGDTAAGRNSRPRPALTESARKALLASGFRRH